MVKVITAAGNQPVWGASMAIEDRYRPMVAKLEAMAARRPGVYRFQVFCRALLGYAYISLVILGILMIVVVGTFVIVTGHLIGLAIKPLIILVFGLFYILRSLFVKAVPPDGVRITAAQAPALFTMLGDIRRKVHGPRVDRVYVTTDFNASIRQVARFGPFAGHRNILSIGLPLLMALSPEEVMAVIGHEYGHLAGAHGKMSAWVYRVRMTWLQLSQNLGKGILGGVFSGFFKWYGPWFNAYSFVLARGDEYQADRAAAGATSARLAAQALTRVEVEAKRHNDFWNSLFDREGMQERVFPHAGMAAYFVQPIAAETLAGAMRAAMAEETDMHDTHPCLKDRLAALHETTPDLPPLTQTGAAVLLGANLVKDLAAQFDAEWWGRAANYWQNRRSDAETRRSRLVELQTVVAQRAFTDDEHWEYQLLLEAENRTAEALAIAEKRLAAVPESVDAQIAVGRLRLEGGDGSGLDLLDGALAALLHDRTRLHVLEIASSHLTRESPSAPRLAEYQAQFATTLARYRAVQEELNAIDQGCVLESAGLDEAATAIIRDRMAQAPAIKAAWLARRRVKSDPEVGQLVLLYENRAKGAEGLTDDLLAMLKIYDNAFVISHSPATDWLRQRMKAIEGACLLKR